MTCIKTSFRILFHPSFHESRPVVLCVHRIFLSHARSKKSCTVSTVCMYKQSDRIYIS